MAAPALEAPSQCTRSLPDTQSRGPGTFQGHRMSQPQSHLLHPFAWVVFSFLVHIGCKLVKNLVFLVIKVKVVPL